MSEPDKSRLELAYKAMSDKKVTDPDVISSVGRVLKEAGFYGETAANAVTTGLSYEQECATKEMLDRLFEINPLLAMNVETNIYSFDMITDLTDRDVQKLLREIDSIVFAKALRGAATDVKGVFKINGVKKDKYLLKISFIGYHKSVMFERAQSIDRFFTMYGYRVNQVKTPSCNNRQQWTYIKTSGCIVHGNLPASAAREIEAAFNRGIRFWANPENIGNYTLNNSPGA